MASGSPVPGHGESLSLCENGKTQMEDQKLGTIQTSHDTNHDIEAGPGLRPLHRPRAGCGQHSGPGLGDTRRGSKRTP